MKKNLKKNISVIIVDYNSIDISINYIKQIRDNFPVSYILHVVLIDNYVQSNGKEILNKKLSFVTSDKYGDKEIITYKIEGIIVLYCHTKDNLGYAKGNNLGTNIADYFFGDEYYLFSNNDIKILDEIPLDHFFYIFEKNDKIAVIGPKIVGINNVPQSPSKRKSKYYWILQKPWYSLLLSHFIKSNGDICWDGKSKYAYRVMGCFMIVKRNPFKMAGGFDERTFLFCEEPILSERLQKIGYLTYYYEDYKIIHEHGKSIRKLSNAKKSYKDIIDIEFESLIYYCKKYLNASDLLIGIAYINKALRNPFYKVIYGIKKFVDKVKK